MHNSIFIFKIWSILLFLLLTLSNLDAQLRLNVEGNGIISGSLGVGTDTPSRTFHVKSGEGTSVIARMESLNPAGATIDFKDPNTTGDFLARIEGKADGLTFIAGGTERMSITYNDVQVKNNFTVADKSAFSVDVSNTDTLKIGNLASSFDVLRIASLGNTEISIDDNNNTGSSNFRIIANGNKEVFSVDDGGNAKLTGGLGIGTETPLRTLHVKSGAGTSIIARLESQNPAGATIDFKDPNTTGDFLARIGGKADGLTFIAGGSERMSMTSNEVKINTKVAVEGNGIISGSLGVGTDTPSRTFHVKSGEGTSIIARMESLNPAGATIDFKDPNTTGNFLARIGGKADGLTFIAGGNERMSITSNEVKITTKVVVEGADVAEKFNINTINAKPGMLVSIDPDNHGELTISQQAYDKKIVGVISGANGVKAGMLLAQEGTLADGDTPVAVVGRVYCYVDATNGPIEAGDFLTTSEIPGFAMKATDLDKARGAIIGKAMTELDKGQGMVLILITLQ